MVVACAALDSLTWSNERTFEFNDYATQLINHYKTLERGEQATTDEEKAMKLLMSTSNVAISIRIKLTYQEVTIQDAIVSLSTSIATIFSLVHVKGHRALVSETGTGSEVSHSTHINGLEFTEHTWKNKFNNEKYRCIPKQIGKLIDFAKHYKFNKKQVAFKAEIQARNISKKRGRKASETSQTDAEDDAVDRAICKIAQALK